MRNSCAKRVCSSTTLASSSAVKGVITLTIVAPLAEDNNEKAYPVSHTIQTLEAFAGSKTRSPKTHSTSAGIPPAIPRCSNSYSSAGYRPTSPPSPRRKRIAPSSVDGELSSNTTAWAIASRTRTAPGMTVETSVVGSTAPIKLSTNKPIAPAVIRGWRTIDVLANMTPTIHATINITMTARHNTT